MDPLCQPFRKDPPGRRHVVNRLLRAPGMEDDVPIVSFDGGRAALAKVAAGAGRRHDVAFDQDGIARVRRGCQPMQGDRPSVRV